MVVEACMPLLPVCAEWSPKSMTRTSGCFLRAEVAARILALFLPCFALSKQIYGSGPHSFANSATFFNYFHERKLSPDLEKKEEEEERNVFLIGVGGWLAAGDWASA